MAITSKTRGAIMKRLSREKQWAESPFGKLCQCLIDTDIMTLELLADYLDKPRVTVWRWARQTKRQGLSHEDQELLNKKFQELQQKICLALVQGKLPAHKDDVLEVINSITTT